MQDVLAIPLAIIWSLTVAYWSVVGFYSDDEKKAGKLINSWQGIWWLLAFIPYTVPISFLLMLVNEGEYRFFRHRGLVFIDEPALQLSSTANVLLEECVVRPKFFEDLGR